MVDADPVNPMRVFAELSTGCRDNAIVTADSGSSANWYARHLRFRDDMRGSLSGNLATMGPGVPYAIGAKFAHPDRPAIAFVGDGAMQMNGMAELITIRQYWQQWDDPRLVVAVLHNNDLNQVTWEMRAMGGRAEIRRIPDPSRRRLRRRSPRASAWARSPSRTPTSSATRGTRALTADRPTVLDVHTDPAVPPIPPHATWEQFSAPMPRCSRVTKTVGASSRRASRPRRRSSCRTRLQLKACRMTGALRASGSSTSLSPLTTTDAAVAELTAAAYTIPTDAPEADGTLQWDSTTLVIPTRRAARTPSGSATPTPARPRCR